jgi:Zn-finger nucleic acid-binding protein
MHLPCPNCGVVYDLTAYRAGQRLRCRCGQIMIKPGEQPEYRAAHMHHCSNCGGQLERGRPDCPFCHALVDMTEARLTAYCAACLSMSKEGARFCCECGEPLTATADAPERAEEQCPRCLVRMRRRTVGRHKPLECPMCCGLFVDAPDLEEMIRHQEQRVGDAATGPGGRPSRAALPADPVTYIKCPVCQTLMNRMNYGRSSGVIIDLCAEHGYWLDPGELEKIAKWVATGGLAEKYQREVEEAKAERARLERSVAAPSMFYATPDPLDADDKRLLGAYATGGFLGLISTLFD